MGRETFRKVITSPELIEQINPKNKKLVDRYIKNYSTKCSPDTVKVYKSNLNIFFVWNLLENDNKFFVDIKKIDYMDFFDFAVTELQWGSARFANMRATLSSFSNWIEFYFDEEYPTFRNNVKKIERLPKDFVRKKSVFTEEELMGLMDWLGENGEVQQQCLLALMMASGARKSELLRFTTTMIDENNTAFDGLFLEMTEEMRVKGRGVNGKHMQRYIIKDMFLPYYHQWLEKRKEIMEKNNVEHDYVFIKQNGEPATISVISGWFEKWDKQLDQPFYAHAIRHFWTTYLLGLGVEKELVQELQQWSSDTLVSLYNDATVKDRKWKGLDNLKQALEQNENTE